MKASFLRSNFFILLILTIFFSVSVDAKSPSISSSYLESSQNGNFLFLDIGNVEQESAYQIEAISLEEKLNNVWQFSAKDLEKGVFKIDLSAYSKQQARDFLLGRKEITPFIDSNQINKKAITGNCSKASDVCIVHIADVYAFTADIQGKVNKEGDVREVGYFCEKASDRTFVNESRMVLEKEKGQFFLVKVKNLKPETVYRCSFSAKFDSGLYHSEKIEIKTGKPRVFLKKISNLSENPQKINEYATIEILANDFGVPMFGAIKYKEKGSNTWVRVPKTGIGIIGAFVESSVFSFKTEKLKLNTDYYLVPEVKSSINNFIVNAFSEKRKNGSAEVIVDLKEPVIFRLKTKPLVNTLKPVIDKAQNPWQIKLGAGVASYGEDFTSWFNIIETKPDGSFQTLQTLPIKTSSKAQSFSQTILIADQEMIIDGNKTLFSFNPKNKYKVLGVAENDLGQSISAVGFDLNVDDIPVFGQTLSPRIITYKWATLEGEIDSLFGPIEAGFFIWEKGKKPNKFEISRAVKKRIEKADKISTLYPVQSSKDYCYAIFTQNETQKKLNSFFIGNEVCFKSASNNFLDIPFFSQNDSRWSGLAWADDICDGAQDNKYPLFGPSGCGDTSLAAIIAYWYDNDPNVKKLWDIEFAKTLQIKSSIGRFGKTPNPYSVNGYVYWNKGMDCDWNDQLPIVLARIGLGLKHIKDNTIANNEKYTNKGIPLLVRCKPSYISGNELGHFIAVSGFWGNAEYWFRGKKFLNYIFANDSAINVVNANDSDAFSRGKNRKLHIGQKTAYSSGCGYQYRNDKQTIDKLDGTTAILPLDYPDENFSKFIFD